MAPRWPNVFVVGAPKAGTTSLWRYLDAHPDIFMSPTKEPNFFLDPAPSARRLTEEEYLRLFSTAGDLPWAGEASGHYFAHPEVPGRIKSVIPEARILICLRDPVERAYSSYWHDVNYGAPKLPFAEVVDEQLSEGSGLPVGADPRHKHVHVSFYSQHVRRYLDVFGAAVRVGFLEDLRADPVGETSAIFTFLGVDTDFAQTISFAPDNVFAVPRNRLTATLMASSRARAAGRAVLREPVRTWVESRIVLRRGQKPPLDAALRARLEAAFEVDREPLEQLLGRPVPWATRSA